jgi:Domain of unknown function (DUF4424)
LPARISNQLAPIGRSLRLLAALLLIIGSLASAAADPGAVSFALGGLQFKKESRISMVRENLAISPELTITVDYEFLNNTDQDVTILMAFPVPPDPCGAADSPYTVFTEDGGGNPRIPFHVWVEGQETKYSTEARAFLSGKSLPTSSTNLGKDYTGLLRSLDIDPEDCSTNAEMPQSATLHLAALGLLARNRWDGGKIYHANWTVQRKYYWTQTFPAKKTTHIKIAYPSMGSSSPVSSANGWDKRVVQANTPIWGKELHDTCGGRDLQRKLAAEISSPDSSIEVSWVDFILVTANYWHGPIKDFVLTVETQDPESSVNTDVSFCWDGPITRPDSTHVVATAHNFSPKRNLHIGFFQPY